MLTGQQDGLNLKQENTEDSSAVTMPGAKRRPLPLFTPVPIQLLRLYVKWQAELPGTCALPVSGESNENDFQE